MANVAFCIWPSAWGGNKIDNCVEQLAYAEVGKRRTKKCWGGLSTNKQFDVKIGTNFIEQRDAIKGGLPRIALIDRSLRGVNNFLWCFGCATGHASEASKQTIAAIDDAAEVASDANRPRDGCDNKANLLFDLINQFEWIEPGTIPLVDEGEKRHIALAADIEQLERLRLDAFGCVEHHDGRIGGRKDSVRVF